MLNPSTDRRPLPRKAKLIVSLLASCLLLPLAVRLGAQNASSKLAGTVFDISGAAVPNATITMTNNKAETIEMTTSGAHGNFDFATLAAGEYELKVVKPGFEEYKAPRIIMAPGQEFSQNITLRPGIYMEEVNVVAKGAAKPQSTETAEKPTRVRLGGDIQAPRLLNKVQPIYPTATKAAGTEGTVILHAIIGMAGHPLSLRVMNRQVDPELARAAVEAVSKWSYSPTLLNGEPIEVDTTIIVNFKLSS